MSRKLNRQSAPSRPSVASQIEMGLRSWKNTYASLIARRLILNEVVRLPIAVNATEERGQEARFWASGVVAFYNLHGTGSEGIKAGMNDNRSSRRFCRRSKINVTRLQLHVLALDLGNFIRTLALPNSVTQ